ncbi:hypothetical protein B0H13DRAFT_1868051 [Mycena leptocephala]|nr:hypothetical protein B0H13DRAFT_1868051 [Mycena leptocephala]
MAFELSSHPDNEITNQMVPGSREQPWGRHTGIVEFLQFSTTKFDTSVLAPKKKKQGDSLNEWSSSGFAGWESRRLPRVGFLDAADPDGGAFGFWIPPKSLEQGISFQHFFMDVPQRLHGVGMLISILRVKCGQWVDLEAVLITSQIIFGGRSENGRNQLVSQASSDDRRRSIKSLGHRYERSMDVLGAPAELWSCSTARGNDMVAAIRRGFKAKYGITALLE